MYLAGFVLLPDDVLPYLPNAVRLDYDYVNGGKSWKINNEASINVEFWSAEKVNALRIAQKLEGS